MPFTSLIHWQCHSSSSVLCFFCVSSFTVHPLLHCLLLQHPIHLFYLFTVVTPSTSVNTVPVPVRVRIALCEKTMEERRQRYQ